MDSEALRKKLLQAFREECLQRAGRVHEQLFTWLADDSQHGRDELHRELHSLKGAARSIGLQNFEALFHRLESLVGRREQLTTLSEDGKTFLRQCMAILLQHIDKLATLDVQPLLDLAEQLTTGHAIDATQWQQLHARYPVASETSKPAISTHQALSDAQRQHLTMLTEQISELATQADATEQQLRHARDDLRLQVLRNQPPLIALRQQMAGTATGYEQGASKRLGDYASWAHQSLDQVLLTMSQLVRMQQAWVRHLHQSANELSLLTDELCFVSCDLATQGMTEQFAALSQELGKSATLSILGGQCRADKDLLESLRSPLWHLVTNALVHGLETPEQRRQKNKPRQGNVSIEFSQPSGDRLRILISDDGAGFNQQALSERAKSLSVGQELPTGIGGASQATTLAFVPGLSTLQEANTVAGRGYGLSAVLKTIEQQGGSISVQSDEQGARIELLVPVNAAVYRIVSFQVADQRFALPALNVDRCLRIAPEFLRRVEQRLVLSLENETLSVFPLTGLLQLPENQDERTVLQGLVVKSHGFRFVLLVDDIIGDHDSRVHALGNDPGRCRPYIGAAISSAHELCPVLSAATLFDLSVGLTAPAPFEAWQETEQVGAQVLLVDDSFTSRGLMQAILETAGYRVTTANDGAEAWRLIQQQNFDLLVSDVEMPRLDGFALTQRIRQDRRFATLPVVLVTALESDADRQRGLESGANAYIVKSTFEQETLLQTLQRFLH